MNSTSNSLVEYGTINKGSYYGVYCIYLQKNDARESIDAVSSDDEHDKSKRNGPQERPPMSPTRKERQQQKVHVMCTTSVHV